MADYAELLTEYDRLALRAEKAEAQLARQRKVIEAARNITIACWQIGAGDYGHMAVHPKDMRALCNALSGLSQESGSTAAEPVEAPCISGS